MKKLGWIALGVLGLLIVGVGAVVYFLDHLAQTAVERGATYALGVRTTVDGVSIGLLSGHVGISDLQVDNPEGFDAEDHFLILEDGELDVPPRALLEQRIIVPRLKLSDIDLVLQKKGARSNYQVILENLERLESGEKPTAKEGDAKTFVVEEVVIENVLVHAYMVQVGSADARAVHVRIKEIRCRYDSDEGLAVDELSNLLLKTIMTAVYKDAAHLLPGLIIDGLGQGLAQLASLENIGDLGVSTVEMAGEIAGQITDKVGKTVDGLGKVLSGEKDAKDVVDDAGEIVEDTGKAVGEGLKKAGEGLGGLLKKKDEKDQEEGAGERDQGTRD